MKRRFLFWLWMRSEGNLAFHLDTGRRCPDARLLFPRQCALIGTGIHRLDFERV